MKPAEETKIRLAKIKLQEATSLLNSLITIPPVIKPKTKRILIAPGHSSKRNGAPGRNGKYNEHDCTVMIARMLQDELEKDGFDPIIHDPSVDDLVADGKQAKGYDAYIAPHLNAYDNDDVDEYTCVLAHPNRRNASVVLANCVAVATYKRNQKIIGSKAKLFGANTKYPGVYFRAVTVLRYSEMVTDDNIPCILPESFFLDAYADAERVEQLCKQAAYGIADGVKEYFSIDR